MTGTDSTFANTNCCWDMEGLLTCPHIGPITPLDVDMMILPEHNEQHDNNSFELMDHDESEEALEYTNEMWMDQYLLDNQSSDIHDADQHMSTMMDALPIASTSHSSSPQEQAQAPYAPSSYPDPPYHHYPRRNNSYYQHHHYQADPAYYHHHHRLPPIYPQHDKQLASRSQPSNNNDSDTSSPSPHLPFGCREHDVVCGRAQEIRTFIGNERFRQIIERHRSDYHAAQRKSEKSRVSTKIYHMITSNGGRFWDKRARNDDTTNNINNHKQKNNNNDKVWYELSQEKAIAKISQALRNGTRPVRGSSYSPERGTTKATATSTTKLVVVASSGSLCKASPAKEAWTRTTSTSSPLSAGSDHSSRTR